MGNQASGFFTTESFINASSNCAAKQVEYNNLQRDLSGKQAEIDSCDPQATLQRRINEEVAVQTAYVTAKTAEFNGAVQQYERERANAIRIQESSSGAVSYLNELTAQLNDAESRENEFERDARRERRRFIDGAPQSGVGGAPGVRTSDDRVLLAFWISYGIAFIFVAILVARIYGMKTTDALKIFIPAALAAYGVAYYFIAYYG
jgi:hypothetical protein